MSSKRTLRDRLERKFAILYLVSPKIRFLFRGLFRAIYPKRKTEQMKRMTEKDERPGVFDDGNYREEQIEKTVRRVEALSQDTLFKIMFQVAGFLKDPKEAKVLSVGPRNEIELYLLVLNGFKWENIEGVDLVASTDKIMIADFSVSLPFPDDSFDVMFAGSSLSKSCDPQRTASEIKGVLKPGGLVAIFDAEGGSLNEEAGQHLLKTGEKRVPTTGFPKKWVSIVELYADSEMSRVIYAQRLSKKEGRKENFECIVEVN